MQTSVLTTITGYSLLCQYRPSPSVVPTFCQPGFFFNEPEHVQQQSSGPFYVLTALNTHTGLAEARCSFFADSDKVVSPMAAPFGSIEFTGALPDAVLDQFLNTLIETVQTSGRVSSLRLVNYPQCYAPEQVARLSVKLSERGFQLVGTNPTFFLPITDISFEAVVVPAERRRLRKCRKAGFQVAHGPLPAVATVVNFIGETRQFQGYPLTIHPDYLTDLLRRFSEHFLVFSVWDGSRLAALTIAIRVRQDILYTFLPATHPDYQRFSPMVMLLDGLFVYCQQHRIQLLDLGTALDENGQPKPGLMRFKRNVGAQESPKLVFEKRFRR
ncbi:GNAT family N-acetyltransferase [Spirosoma koreense]